MRCLGLKLVGVGSNKRTCLCDNVWHVVWWKVALTDIRKQQPLLSLVTKSTQAL